MIVSIPLPDRRTKSHIGKRKLPPIVGPKSDMADYRRLHPIIIFPQRKFSHCPIFHPIFHPTLRSSDQSGNGTPALSSGSIPTQITKTIRNDAPQVLLFLYCVSIITIEPLQFHINFKREKNDRVFLFCLSGETRCKVIHI